MSRMAATERPLARSPLRTVLTHVQRHGLLAMWALILFEPLRRLHLLWVGGIYRTSTQGPESLQAVDPRLEARFLDEAEILALVRSESDWFFPEAVRRSLARGERCFAVLVDGLAVSTRWYASGPLRQFGVHLRAPADTRFEHRVYTHEQWRGQGLAFFAQVHGCEKLRADGIAWTIATIEATNASSVAAFRKAGAERVGWIVQFGPDAWRCSLIIRTSSACPTRYSADHLVST